MDDYVKRLKACKNWQWEVGMITHNGYLVWRVEEDTLSLVTLDLGALFVIQTSICEEVPDITKSSTKGCLMAQLREAWPDNKNINKIVITNADTGESITRWNLRTYGDDEWYKYEEDVILAALEVLPVSTTK